MRKFLSYFLVLFVAVSLFACNEDVDKAESIPVTPGITTSSACKLTKMYLKLATADEMAASDYYVQCAQDGNAFSVVNQKSVSLSAVPVKFEISAKSKIYVKGSSTELTSETSTVNFSSGTVTFEVIAENGTNKSEYMVTVTSY